jgi:hypothetical protein
MGGKSATTTQQVQIPREVMERYTAVNKRAESAAATPFQAYSNDPNAFVAPINQTQQAGINSIAGAQNSAGPYFNTAAGLTMGGAQGVGQLGSNQINQYLSPYLGTVLGTTMQGMDRQNAIQRNALTGDAIKSGAYGGDRAGIAQANLAYDQNLSNNQAIANILNQGYGQAVQTAQGQQGVQAQDYQRMLAAGQQLGGLGAQATQTQLAAGQSLLGAGTAEQQTDQAGKSALYNQFLQERGYPFQVAQFLGNIAMGTGALSGSTTTTTQPVPFFSDPRLKEDAEPIGETYDGQQIYRYRMKGDPRHQIGLMADEVEQRHPEAVGLAAGFRTLDYETATDDAASRGRQGYAPGGLVAGDDIRAVLEAQKQAFGPFAQAGLYGGNPQQGGVGKPGFVPQASLPVPKLMTAGAPPSPQRSMAAQTMQGIDSIKDLGKTASDFWDSGKKGLGYVKSILGEREEEEKKRAYGGGLVPRYAFGGDVEQDDEDSPISAYDTPGPGIDIPNEQSKAKLPEPGKPPAPPNSIMGDILGVAKTAASIYAMSDRRTKDNIDPVGETYDGQSIYRYDHGDGRTRLGLMADEVLRHRPDAVAQSNGLMMVDYDRATEDAVPRAYGGGLMPRNGYAEGGIPSAYREYVEEASRETGIPVRFLAAKIQQEGQWRPDARGGAGEIGMTQVLPSTARDPGFGVRPVDPEVLRTDPREQILFGARYLAGRGRSAGVEDWNDQGQVAKALRAYNGGGDPRYVENVFKHLPRFGGEAGLVQPVASTASSGAREPRAPALAYSPEAGVAGPAQSAIATRAGGGEGLGRAAPAREERASAAGAEPSGREESLLQRFTPNTLSGQKQSPSDLFTSKQFWIPVLSGLGAMASSPSLYAGSAILQGLGAGAQAYGNLEKQQADIDQTKASTFETAQRAANLSTRQVGNVTFIRLADGTEVPVWEWIRGRQPTMGGKVGQAAAESAAQRYLQGVGLDKDQSTGTVRRSGEGPSATGVAPPAPGGSPSGGPAPEPTGVAAGQPNDPAAPAQSFSVFGSNSQRAADKDIEATLGPNGQTAQEVSRRYATTTESSASAAREAATGLNEMTLNVARVVAGKGYDAPGTAYAARAELARAANTVARALGYKGEPFSEADKLQDLQAKFNTLQAADIARGGGQESYNALRTMIEALPRTDMAPDAQAQIAAQLLMLNRKAQDRDEHRIRYGERSMQSFTAAGNAFTADNPETRYVREVDLIKNVIRYDPQAVELLTSGRATPAQVEEYFKNVAKKIGKPFVPGIGRYFAPGG